MITTGSESERERPGKVKKATSFHHDCCLLAQLFSSAFVRLLGEQAHHAAPSCSNYLKKSEGKNVTSKMGKRKERQK